MSVSGWTLLAIIAALLFISRRYQESEPVRHFPNSLLSGGHGAIRSKQGIFSVKVLALEFDEDGPSIYINGEFLNGDEPSPIDFTTARINAGGIEEVFVSFNPDEGVAGCGSCRGANLITFFAPVTLHPHEKGLFRTPLFCEEKKEKIANLIDGLEQAAIEQVAMYDKELGGYSLDGPEYEKLEERFLNSKKVSSIGRLLYDELFWRVGPIAITLFWRDHGDDEEESAVDAIGVDEVSITINLDDEAATILNENVATLMKNALRNEFELESASCRSVAIDL